MLEYVFGWRSVVTEATLNMGVVEARAISPIASFGAGRASINILGYVRQLYPTAEATLAIGSDLCCVN